MSKIFFPILLILTIVLTACSSQTTGTPATSSSTSLPMETQIAVGTLKLSGTDQDITVEQAKNLVIYWQVYKQLSQSDTAAQAEVDGLVTQIQETMTNDQLKAITDMNLTQQDVFASTQGVTVTSSSSGNSNFSTSSRSSGGGGMSAGEPPTDGGGAPPDGGMPGDFGGAASASGTTKTQSTQASSGSSVTAQVPSALVQAVIQALQQKIAA